MKLKIIVRLVEKILGMRDSADELRADMFLPDWILAFGLVLLAVGTGIGLSGCVNVDLRSLILGIVMILGGILAVLCWKNQTIVIISEEKFEYTTFLGNKKVFAFADITGLRKNKDSMTLYLGSEKVHIEACAIMTEELIILINQALQG